MFNFLGHLQRGTLQQTEFGKAMLGRYFVKIWPSSQNSRGIFGLFGVNYRITFQSLKEQNPKKSRNTEKLGGKMAKITENVNQKWSFLLTIFVISCVVLYSAPVDTPSNLTHTAQRHC